MTVTTEIGKARARKEDARLLTGQTNWTDNIQLPGLVHVAYLRSPMAHARITSVDVSAAHGAPGVIAAADLLRDNPNPTEQEVREGLEGNLCRCTGYQNIVRAVMRAASASQGAAS